MICHCRYDIITGNTHQQTVNAAFDDTTDEKQRNRNLYAVLQKEMIMPQAPYHTYDTGNGLFGDIIRLEQWL